MSSSHKTSGRLQDAPAAARPQVLSFRERIAKKTSPGDSPLFHRPLPSVFLGAGLLSGSKYLIWRSQRIRERFPNAAASSRYRDWVVLAQSLIEKGSPACAVDGYSLMYYLLIEPFALRPQAEELEI